MDNSKNPQNCWEFWNCPKEIRENCLAYKLNAGKECWCFAEDFKPSPLCPKVQHNFEHCWDCPWFKKLNPDFHKEESVEPPEKETN